MPQHAKPNYQKDMNRSTDLHKDLCNWRKLEFSHHYSDCLSDIWLGDWVVLGDAIIDDIIYLVNCNKLLSQEDFIQLVNWQEHSCYTAELIPIIHKIFPPAMPPSASAQSPVQPSTAAGSHAAAQPCTQKCGNCKQTGHNSGPTQDSLFYYN